MVIHTLTCSLDAECQSPMTTPKEKINDFNSFEEKKTWPDLIM